jgi:hypothetical protein
MSKLSRIAASAASVRSPASPIAANTNWVCGDGFAGAVVLAFVDRANQSRELQDLARQSTEIEEQAKSTPPPGNLTAQSPKSRLHSTSEFSEPNWNLIPL